MLFTVDRLEPSATTCCTAFLTALNKWIIVFATLSYDFKLIKKSLAEQLEQLPESDSRLGNSEKQVTDVTVTELNLLSKA